MRAVHIDELIRANTQSDARIQRKNLSNPSNRTPEAERTWTYARPVKEWNTLCDKITDIDEMTRWYTVTYGSDVEGGC